MGGSETKTVENSSKELQLPQWVQDAGVSNYNYAKDIVAGQDYQTNWNQTAAPVTADTNAGYDMMRANAGSTQSAYDTAMGGVTPLMAYQPQNVSATPITAGQVAGRDISPYMNPFTQQVTDRAMTDLDLQRQKALMQNSSDATAARAFGGGRFGLVEGQTNEGSARAAGDLSANLNKTAYDNAMSLMTGDINRTMTADQFNAGQGLQAATTNASNDITGAGLRKSAAESIAALAGAKQQSGLTDAAGLLDIGKRQQAQSQTEADVARANNMAPYEFSKEKLNVLLSSLGMTPYNKTEVGTGTSTKESGTDWASVLLGGAKMAAGFM